MRKRVARLAGARLFGVLAWGALAGWASGVSSLVVAERPAFAQPDAELAAARKLFGEALAEEQAGQFALALEKFRRVQGVRDTQAVRYRIATCLEALGKLRAALAMFASTSIAAGNDTEGASIARASREKADALSKRVPRLIVVVTSVAPPDAVVKVDGEVVHANVLGTPMVIDPGAHEVTATGSGVLPFHAEVTASEGGESRVEVSLAAAPPPPPVAPAPPSPAPPPPVERAEAPPPPPPSHAASRGRATAGAVALGAGGVLVAGSIVLLLIRQADIDALNNACPGGLCPLSRESELDSRRSRALLEGPLAAALGVAGVAAAGVGVFLLASPARSHASRLAPWVERGGGGMSWTGAF